MKHKTAKTAAWQDCGGFIEIPAGWYVHGANFDVEEPYIEIANSEIGVEHKRILFPKPIAYYLSTHWCGSEVMHEIIEENTRHEIRSKVKDALGL